MRKTNPSQPRLIRRPWQMAAPLPQLDSLNYTCYLIAVVAERYPVREYESREAGYIYG